jgi:ATP-dependent exoDNAse (exonuclease V) alpha subunit
MTWSPQQDQALQAVARWARDDCAPQVFRLFGYAGTGKTTLARQIAQDVGGDVCFGAFTGKAAMVLRSKGCRGAQTIHSMIYTLDAENFGEPTFRLNYGSEVADADLVIIDECSMVDRELGLDLLSFGTKVLVLGDPAQLPPVSDDAGFFTSSEPDIMLTEVHRQARDNPIIHLSMMVREGTQLRYGRYGDSIVTDYNDEKLRDLAMGADQILVGKNDTRVRHNKRVRQLKKLDPQKPVNGDRLICLRNNRHKGLLNGGMWTAAKVKRSRGKTIGMVVASAEPGLSDRTVPVKVHRQFFNGAEGEIPWIERKGTDEFTFGYAITVHKSQGSQWDRVCLFDESSCFRENRTRHLYTGITRAAQQITVVM